MAKLDDEVDVLIVGAGAAASVYAAVLAQAGRKVLIFERGAPRVLADLYSSQIWARRLKWGAPSVIESGPDTLACGFNLGHGTGGAAVHHYAVWPRMHAEDFRLASRYRRGRDWPLDYDTLRPFYDEVQGEVGVSGDAGAEPWRPPGAPYPLPPVLVSEHGRTLAKGFAALGMQTAPLPLAVLSRPYKGRAGCLWDGWCDAGCPIGALANPLAVYLPQALKRGAEVRNGCQVTQVLTTRRGERATGVAYVDAQGRARVQRARIVVLAANNIENARLLLASANAAHPRGLANRSDWVGRGLMSHAAVLNFGLFAHEMQNHLGATGGQLLNQDHFRKDGNGDAFGSRGWLIGNALKPNDLLGIAMSRPDLFGEPLHAFLLQAAHHMGCMNAVCEDQALPENRVELAPERDARGLPRARIHYRRSDDASRLAAQAGAEGVAVFKAAGATEAWHGPTNPMHILGGTVMGHDAATSVTNGNAQTHEIGNLFIGGSGLFASASCVNPTFTVHALALKSARVVARQFGSLVA